MQIMLFNLLKQFGVWFQAITSEWIDMMRDCKERDYDYRLALPFLLFRVGDYMDVSFLDYASHLS